MHHCVGSYAPHCRRGRSSIWSLRRYAGGLDQRSALTIEIDRDSRTIVEAKGLANRSPTPAMRSSQGQPIVQSVVPLLNGPCRIRNPISTYLTYKNAEKERIRWPNWYHAWLYISRTQVQFPAPGILAYWHYCTVRSTSLPSDRAPSKTRTRMLGCRWILP